MKLLLKILSFLFVLSGCSTKNSCELNTVLMNIQRDLYYIPSDNWEIRQKVVFPDTSIFYNLYQDQGDTIYQLQLNIFCSEFYKNNEDKYQIATYLKRYFDSTNFFDIFFEQDTVIFYKALMEDRTKKEFYVGKYYYMFLHPKELFKLGYSEDDFLYIHDNLDSLKKIRGDSLVFP
jgi:hypothetical protein